MAVEIVITATLPQVRSFLRRLSRPSQGLLARAVLVRAALAALSKIHEAFVVKARGGTDESGLSWPPLAPSTIAYKRRHPLILRSGKTSAKRTLPRSADRAGHRPSYALSKSERERWWQIYRQSLRRYHGNKAAAAKVAWHVLKQSGAKTLMQLYGNSPVEILKDTGLLINSLTPGIPAGVGQAPNRSAKQIFQLGVGQVTIGTRRAHAEKHHEGRPPHLPQRRLWPEPSSWPASWWEEILTQAREGLIEAAVEILGGTA